MEQTVHGLKHWAERIFFAFGKGAIAACFALAP